jgi:hypothetical protein
MLTAIDILEIRDSCLSSEQAVISTHHQDFFAAASPAHGLPLLFKRTSEGGKNWFIEYRLA